MADGDFDREFLVAEGDICLMGGLIEIVDRNSGGCGWVFGFKRVFAFLVPPAAAAH